MNTHLELVNEVNKMKSFLSSFDKCKKLEGRIHKEVPRPGIYLHCYNGREDFEVKDNDSLLDLLQNGGFDGPFIGPLKSFEILNISGMEFIFLDGEKVKTSLYDDCCIRNNEFHLEGKYYLNFKVCMYE